MQNLIKIPHNGIFSRCQIFAFFFKNMRINIRVFFISCSILFMQMSREMFRETACMKSVISVAFHISSERRIIVSRRSQVVVNTDTFCVLTSFNWQCNAIYLFWFKSFSHFHSLVADRQMDSSIAGLAIYA